MDKRLCQPTFVLNPSFCRHWKSAESQTVAPALLDMNSSATESHRLIAVPYFFHIIS